MPNTDFQLSSFVPDDAPPGAEIGVYSIPDGFDASSLTLLWDEAGAFALDGDKLVVGSTLLTPGSYQPIARIRSLATPYTYAIFSEDIVVTPRWAPSQLSSYVTGWYPEAGLTVNDLNQVTSWISDTGDYTASQAAGSACPTLEPGYGPGGKDVVKFDGAQSQFLNISPALPFSGGAIVAIYQPRSTSANKTLLGQTSGGRFLWQTSATSVSLNMGTTRAVTPVAAAALSTNRLSCLILSYDGTTGALSAEVDGVPTGGGGGAGVSPANFTLLGKHSTGNFGNYYLSALFLLDAPPTTDVKARIQAWARGRRTTAFVFASNGSNANTGFNLANAKADPMAYVSGLSANGLRAGDKILMRGGDTFYGAITTAAGLNLRSASQPLIFDSFGAGLANIYGTPPAELTWAPAGGDQWSASLARDHAPLIFWAYPDGLGANPVRIYSRPVSQAHSFQYAAGVLTINLGPGLDPNAVPIFIPKDASDQQFFGLSGSFLKFRRLRLRHFVGQVFAPQSGTGTAVIQCEIGWSADDGVSPGGTSTGAAICNTIVATGRSRSTTSGPGDGMSVHGGTFHSQSNVFRQCGIAGIRNEMGTNFLSEGDTIEDCNEPLRVLFNAAYAGPATQTFIGAKIVRSVDDQQADGLLIDSGVTSAISVTVTGCSFTGQGPVRGKAINKAGAAVLTQTGNEQSGFNSLT